MVLRGQKVLIFDGLGTKRLIFSAPGKDNIDFWYTDKRVLIFGAQRIFIFGVPGTENIDFSCMGTKNIDFWCSGDRKY